MDQKKEYAKIVQSVADKLAMPAIENYYPIIDRPLTKHNGITITGNFETDDDTASGRLSYVTVLRDSNSLDPANGLGFAWMKGDGTMYNVYLVDNSPLANDLFISNTFVVNENGENTWKAAAKVEILVNTTYKFKLVIGEDYAISLKVWADGDTEPVSNTVQIGAPLSAVAASGDRFGIGVMGTNNCQWWYDDIVITASENIHTAVLYRLKALPSDFPSGSSASINFYGYGVDGNAPSQLYGVTTFLRTKTDSTWDWVQIGTNESTEISDRTTTKISKDIVVSDAYVSDDGFIDLLATTTYATSTVTDLTTYYVSLEQPVVSGVHVGGCADIYVNDSSYVVAAEQTVDNITGIVDLSAANGFLGPIHSIISVQVALVGDTFVPNQDWVLVSGDTSSTLSVYEYPRIVFNPELAYYKVKVTYRYYQRGQAIQTMLESDNYRYSGTSNVLKIMPPITIRFNDLVFRGSITDVGIKTLLKNYVNAQTSRLVRSEIINLLYRNGVTYIDLSTLSIGVIETDYNRVSWDEVELVDTYYKPALSAFYTDTYEMDGIRRQ